MTVLTKDKASNLMMRFAWGLEIILCLTGILIAFTLSYIGVSGGEEGLSFKTKLILTIGMLPLIGVALSELFKIPMVTGLIYAKTIKVKTAALIALAAICVLTFETMLTGQEQIFSLRSEHINKHKIEVNKLTEQNNLIDQKIESISALSPSDIKQEAEASLSAQLQPINEQIDDLRKRELSLRSSNDSAEVQELLRQVEFHSETKSGISNTYRLNLQAFNNEMKELNKNEQSELDGAFLKGGIRNKYAERRADIKKQITDLESTYRADIKRIDLKIAALNNKVADLSQPSEQLQDDLKIIASQIMALQQDKNKLIKANNENVASLLQESKNSKAIIDELNIQKASITEELNAIRDLLALSANESFMHRLCALYYGVDNLADLTEEQVGNFALIFMMSVAAVVSLAGPALTFIAYSLHVQNDDAPKRFPMRAMAKSLIKRARSPKVITKIKEVEVEKEVTKQVPVEIPLFIQVPVPTDPKDLPKMEELKPAQLRPIAVAGGRA